MPSDVERAASNGLDVPAFGRARGAVERMARVRYLPVVEAEPHVICTGETVAFALQRITTHEFTVAIDALTDPDIETGAGADLAATALHRIASLLRLVRGTIGADVCASELDLLGDATDFLAGLVTGRAEIRSLDELRIRYDAALRPDAFSALREQLLDHHQLLRLEQLPILQPGGERSHWCHQLRRARARFAAWPVEGELDGTQPLADDFDSFADGLHRTYRKGRKRGDRTEPDLTKWRRDARDLAHQVELLSGAWPDVLSGTVATAADLAAVLSEHDRLRALRDAVNARGRRSPRIDVDDVTAAVVTSLCEHEEAELREIAGVLAARLYAEQPDDFVARLRRYWATRP